MLTFLTVHRCGAITGAARALKVTPSQVSKAVHRLERQLGATLLSRSTRGVIVTDAGRRLIPQLEEVAARLQQMRPDAATREELALAAPSYLNAIFLPRIAAELADVVVRGLELPPALVRAYAVENFFDVALVVGSEKLPGAWVNTPVGEVRKALYATPEVARRLGSAPVDPKRVAELPFVTPIYNVNGQFVPADDGCPLGHAQRKARSSVADAGGRARSGALDGAAHLRAGDRRARPRGARRAGRGARARLGRARAADAGGQRRARALADPEGAGRAGGAHRRRTRTADGDGRNTANRRPACPRTRDRRPASPNRARRGVGPTARSDAAGGGLVASVARSAARYLLWRLRLRRLFDRRGVAVARRRQVRVPAGDASRTSA